jgi:AcrR family transcriptional regulator
LATEPIKRNVRDAPTRNTGRRVDSRATRKRLLAAVGRLLDHGHDDITLQRVAEEAEVSTATAYRYFGSVDDAVIAYVIQFPDSVAESFTSREQGETGLARLALWSSTWIRLTDDWGGALVHLRSPEGFLARRDAGEPVISTVCGYLEPPMVEALAELELPPDSLPMALFLWNAIYDPREILDLRRTLRWTRGKVERILLSTFIGAVRGSARRA